VGHPLQEWEKGIQKWWAYSGQKVPLVGLIWQRGLHLLEQGHNLAVTGCAGTGKSYLIKVLVEVLHNQGKQVVVTVSTGMAAVNLRL